MKLLQLLTTALAALVLTAGCARRQNPAIEIVRLDKAISRDSVTPDLLAASDAWIYARTGIVPTTDGERDSLLSEEAASAAYRVFLPDVDARLRLNDGISRAIGKIDSVPKRIYGIISPYQQSVVVIDTIILVALNHYLGEDYPGYASFPGYLRKLKTADRLPADIAEAWTASRHPFADSIASPTVVQQMVYQGAVLAIVADMLGMADGGELMGWSREDWDDAEANEREAWHRLVSRGILFSDDPDMAARLTNPAPSTPDISPDAPGRLGRFIGLRIVRSTGRDPREILATGGYLDAAIIKEYAKRVN